MAREFKATPILRGKDAKRFGRIMKENATRKVPLADYERALAVFRKVKIVSKSGA